MALVKTSGIIGDISGRLNDQVYLRTQGGLAVRGIGTWTQPDTHPQLAARAAMAAITSAWSATLNALQRAGWWTYARTHPGRNHWGERSNSNGYAAFVRHNFRAYLDSEVLQFPDCPGKPPIHRPQLAITIQANGALVLTGTLSPNIVGTYVPGPTYNDHPSWHCDTAAGEWFLFWHSDRWYLCDALAYPTSPMWYAWTVPTAAWQPYGGATGTGSATWSYAASLARITTPPTNYPDPGALLTIYLYSGKPITAGRNFYNGPWRHVATLDPPTPHDVDETWLNWTWPVHATPPPYSWPGDGSGHVRAYAVAQDAGSGAISQANILHPTMENLSPW